MKFKIHIYYKPDFRLQYVINVSTIPTTSFIKTLFIYSQIFYLHNFANKHNRSWHLSLYPFENLKDNKRFKLVFLQDNVTYLMNFVNTSNNKSNLIFSVIILQVVSADKFLTI